MKLKRTINQVAAVAKTDFLGVLRNKTAIFFTLLFPLFFILIIGFTFGQTGTSSTSSIVVGVVNLDNESIEINGKTSINGTIGDTFIEALETANFSVRTFDEYGDRDSNGTAAYEISRGNLGVILVIPANFTETLAFHYVNETGMLIPTKANLEIFVDPTDTTASMIRQQSILGFISGFVKHYQEIIIEYIPVEMQGVVEVLTDPIIVTTSNAEVTENNLQWIDFMVPGTLGLVLLWSGLNHASMTIATERTKGTFQRMIIAPVSPSVVLIGKLISNLALVYMSGFIMLASGVLLFQVNLYWNIPVIILAMFLGSLSAIGIGLIISSVAKNEEAANSIAVIISVPLQFFIGAFFPLEMMPPAAQTFGQALPFTKMVDAMKAIMTRNLGVDVIFPELLYLTVSGIILFAIGTIAYRLALKRL
ncbi:MAG: ABC transporter permease [Candidatus Bathyarchaeota archaeon]|nr:ABC transporter permease [Candidatus Bathyarchaeum tardum]WGM88724.1 MAG: ABC transporter permease [Candidatus Bathyarchaeum tardum]WNZ29022.1 MAG: ABC transporter permease [Candidatus Bathyarchaeota archaeon]